MAYFVHMHIDNLGNLGNNIYVIFSNILGHYVFAPLNAAVDNVIYE